MVCLGFSALVTQLHTHYYYYRKVTVSEWLKDCEEFALQHAPDHPVLYYHLSLVNALAKQRMKSQNNFHNYLSKYVILQWYLSLELSTNYIDIARCIMDIICILKLEKESKIYILTCLIFMGHAT